MHIHKSKIIVFVLAVGLLFFAKTLRAQSSFAAYIDSAVNNNPDIIFLQSQLKQLDLEDLLITARLQSPQAYLSSDLLFAPYLNNKKLVDISPSDNAIGYDSGITNGGLYSFLFNVDFPLMKKVELKHRISQNELEKSKLKLQIKTLEIEIQQTIGNLYFDALDKQALVENSKKNLELLKDEITIVGKLADKGLFRISDYKLLQLEAQSDSVGFNQTLTEQELAVRQLKVACGIRNNDVALLLCPSLQPTKSDTQNSLFILPYQQDSLRSVNSLQIEKDQYRPQVNLFLNSGLNSTAIPNIERRVGMSAGLHFSYILFDGHQKKINERQQQLHLEDLLHQKKIKQQEIQSQRKAYLSSIEKSRDELNKQKRIQKEYDDLMYLYQEELKRAQIGILDFINYLKKYSDVNLAVAQKEITLNKLINEFNYWNN